MTANVVSVNAIVVFMIYLLCNVVLKARLGRKRELIGLLFKYILFNCIVNITFRDLNHRKRLEIDNHVERRH